MPLTPNTGMAMCWGAASVVGATGASTPSPAFRLGAISATARSAAGVYSVTLGTGQGVDAAECQAIATLNIAGVVASDIYCVQTADTTFAVTTFQTGAAADLNWKISIWKFRAST